MDISIYFEDESLVVIDKPAGVVVNRAETIQEETLQDWWDSRYREKVTPSDDENYSYFMERSGMVHRLDRETSGVMIFAKTLSSFTELLRQFKEREIEKEYLALTHGRWSEKHGTITALVGRMRHNRKMFGVREDGRESITDYRVEQEFTSWEFPREMRVDDRGYTGFTLVRFFPKTGRTHQIRVHARHVNHPLVGDFVYAGRKRSREDRKWSQRILLHAHSISFFHPQSNERLTIATDGKAFHEQAAYLR